MREKAAIKERKALIQFKEVIGSVQEDLLLLGYDIQSPVWENRDLDNLPNEIWKDIPNHEGYQASNYGRIKSIINQIILKQYFDSGGYLYLVPGNEKKKKVHRLVAFAFYGKNKKKIQVNHKKGWKWHNALPNIEWSTPRDNQIHSYETGLKPKFFGSQNVNSISVNQYDLSGKFIKRWESIKMAERELGIDDAPIAKCCKLDVNYSQAYGFIWRFAHLTPDGDLPKGEIRVKNKPKFEKRRATTIKNKALNK